MTHEELVEAFMKLNQRWFADPANTLFGFDTLVRAGLLRYLREGRRPPIMESFHQLEYCINKLEELQYSIQHYPEIWASMEAELCSSNPTS